jgi:hypothetical protein
MSETDFPSSLPLFMQSRIECTSSISNHHRVKVFFILSLLPLLAPCYIPSLSSSSPSQKKKKKATTLVEVMNVYESGRRRRGGGKKDVEKAKTAGKMAIWLVEMQSKKEEAMKGVEPIL